MRFAQRKIIPMSVLVGSIFIGCSTDLALKQNTESSTSAIRAAEELGATKIPNASYYLQLAKEELEGARELAANSKKVQATSLLWRANADAELAVLLSHEDVEKNEAKDAVNKVRQLQKDNQLSGH